MTFSKRDIYRRLQDDSGSLTLEASLVLPGVLIITFALILFSVFMADRVSRYYSISIAGERTAFAWAHSSADIRSGGYPAGANDGLYWRLKDDAMLTGLLGWAKNGDSDPMVRLGSAGSREGESGGIDSVGRSAGSGSGGEGRSGESGSGSGNNEGGESGSGSGNNEGGESSEGDGSAGHSLALKKLFKTASTMPAGIKGAISYRNRLWVRKIEIAADGIATPDPLRRLWPFLPSFASSTVSAVVVEPSEWMRTFQVLRYYQARIQEKGQGADDYRSQAAAVLERRR